MRSRFFIPAAILVTLAYVKRRLDAYDLAQIQAAPPVPDPTAPDRLRRAQAEAADAIAIASAQTAAAAVELPPAHEPPHEALLAQWAAGPDWSAPAPAAQAAPEPAAPAPADPPAPVDEVERALLSEWTTTVIAAPVPSRAPEPTGATDAPPPVVEVVISESGRFTLGGWAAQPGDMAVCGVTFRDRRGAPVDAASIRLVPEAATNVADGGLVVLGDPGFAPDADGFTIVAAAAEAGTFAASGRYEVLAA